MERVDSREYGASESVAHYCCTRRPRGLQALGRLATGLEQVERDCVALRRLTFEVRRGRRWDARPARPMITNTVARAWWPAVGPRLDRGVRLRLRPLKGDRVGESL